MIEILNTLLQALQYSFIIKALLVGSLIAVCCSFLGLFLVLKKYSLIGDGLAHVSFAAAAISLFFSFAPFFVTVSLVIVAAIVILKLNEKTGLHGDAAIGLISSLSIAVGVLIASLAQGFNVDLMSFLFGSILVISNLDVVVSILLSLFIIGIILFYYKKIFAISYDEEFARTIGIPVTRINYILIILTAITISLGIRLVGTLLISSLIIFPTVSALQVSNSFKTATLTSALISIFCVVVGVLGSYVLNLPTGASIVLLNAVCFCICFGTKQLTR